MSRFDTLVKGYVEEKALAMDVPHSISSSQLADINSLVSATGSDGSAVSPVQSNDATTVAESSLLALNPPDGDYIQRFKADQVVQYTVQPGDTIGLIAATYSVSVDTIVWANKLTDPDSLSLGKVLRIPPVSGVIHTVQTGDTVASIAKKYKADSGLILTFNKLQDDQTLAYGDELMVPGGELPGPKPIIKTVATIKRSSGSGIYKSVGNGQCVDFVQAHGFSRMSGNAYTWKRYINTKTPVTGGVIVLRGGRYGHVALVTSVKADSVQIVEQNYYGPYIIDHREIALNDKSIVGYIR